MANFLLKCKFCSNELERVDFYEDSHEDEYIMICNTCPIKVRFLYKLYPDSDDSFELRQTMFVLEHGGKTYGLKFNHEDEEFTLREISSKEIYWATIETIIKLDFLPDIIPSNATQKLPTLLMYS